MWTEMNTDKNNTEKRRGSLWNWRSRYSSE